MFSFFYISEHTFRVRLSVMRSYGAGMKYSDGYLRALTRLLLAKGILEQRISSMCVIKLE